MLLPLPYLLITHKVPILSPPLLWSAHHHSPIWFTSSFLIRFHFCNPLLSLLITSLPLPLPSPFFIPPDSYQPINPSSPQSNYHLPALVPPPTPCMSYTGHFPFTFQMQMKGLDPKSWLTLPSQMQLYPLIFYSHLFFNTHFLLLIWYHLPWQREIIALLHGYRQKLNRK